MPDPGEVVFLEASAAPARLPTAPGAGALVVHLATRAPHGFGAWITACPADVDGLPAGEARRPPVEVFAVIDCDGCRLREPEQVALVDGQTRLVQRRQDRRAADAVEFLQWAAGDLEAAALIGDVPGPVAAKLAARWAQSRPPQ